MGAFENKEETAQCEAKKQSDDDRRIVTNEQTGGQKEIRDARFDLVPVGPLWKLAEHYGKAAGKYPPHNWERGIDWGLCYGAMMRHATKWWGGEDFDPETQAHHLTCVAWHAFALLEYAETHPELDDRVPSSLTSPRQETE